MSIYLLAREGRSAGRAKGMAVIADAARNCNPRSRELGRRCASAGGKLGMGRLERNNERERDPSACLAEVGEQGAQGAATGCPPKYSSNYLPPPSKK